MKATGYLKRYRMRVLLLLLALAMMGVCMFCGFKTEPAKAEENQKQIKIPKLQAGMQQAAGEQNTGKDTDKPEAVPQNKGAESTYEEIKTVPKQKKNAPKSATGRTSSGNEQMNKTPPVHEHNWTAVTKTRKETRRIPVYGDRCHTCNKNITGFAEAHILGGNCTGYDTDVIISYDEVTEEIPYVTYVCSCGAAKE